VWALVELRPSAVALQVNADGLGEGALVGVAVETDRQQVQQLDGAGAVAHSVRAFDNEFGGELLIDRLDGPVE
jgi:argininosuccinate lyase